MKSVVLITADNKLSVWLEQTNLQSSPWTTGNTEGRHLQWHSFYTNFAAVVKDSLISHTAH